MNKQGFLAATLAAAAMGGLVYCNNGSAGRQSPTVESPSEASGAAAATGGHTFDAADQFGLVGAPVKGSEDAIVTIVEFSEFQCPFCSRVLPTLNQILEDPEFAGKVRVVFKNLPLGFHDRARPAAIAAAAAHRQGKFWEFHDLAFANQRDLTDENFIAWAEQIGLDMEKFRADLADAELAAQVDADAAMANSLGIQGTPNFLINGTPLTGAQPFEAFQTAIRAEIEATQALIDGGQSAGDAYAARLAATASARGPQAREEQQRPPARPQPDPNAEMYVPVGASAVKGSDNALVTIVEFSEFQCPFCSRVGPTISQIMETYGDDVRIVFKHRPLDFHDRAMPAARAAIAAQNQGKFWEYHDILFANQRELTDENLVAYAEQLGLNIEQFRTDMAAEATNARIQEDMQLADRLAAGGTPHFFVNGIRIRGAVPFENFRSVIDEQLAIARAAVEGGASRSSIYDALQEDAIRGPAPMIQPAAQPAARPAEPAGPFEIAINGQPQLGPDNAPVTFVMYSDFTCGYCNRFHSTVYEALEGYEDRVRVIFKQYPRSQPPSHAVAALAAHAQGKFWEYHDQLFAQRAGSREDFIRLATELGLNVEQFTAALDDPALVTRANAERDEGAGFGVRGTPTWFVNGNRQVGAVDAATLRAAWDSALNAE